MSLLDELKQVGVDIEVGAEEVAALIWGAAKAAGKAGEQAFVAAIPGAAKKLKEYAKQTVESIAADPAFAHAVGDWKFGAACSRVVELIVADYPALAALGGTLLKGAVETAVQAAFAAMVVGL